MAVTSEAVPAEQVATVMLELSLEAASREETVVLVALTDVSVALVVKAADVVEETLVDLAEVAVEELSKEVGLVMAAIEAARVAIATIMLSKRTCCSTGTRLASRTSVRKFDVLIEFRRGSKGALEGKARPRA